MSVNVPGYDQSTKPPGDAVSVFRAEKTLTAVRVTGPFLIRVKNHVDHIQDGWVVTEVGQDSFGVEDVDAKGAIITVPPTEFLDVVNALPAAQEGVAYSQAVAPPANGAETVVSAVHTFGGNYASLSVNTTDPTSVLLAGTPTTPTHRFHYFEITFTWTDGKVAVMRYALAILAP